VNTHDIRLIRGAGESDDTKLLRHYRLASFLNSKELGFAILSDVSKIF
jgi:hypothetical protein